MAHRRPLNGGMAHHQEMVDSAIPVPLDDDDVNEIAGFVVTWDIIPGITHRKNRPETSHNSSGNPLNARVARRTTTFKHRKTISGSADGRADPVASSLSLSVRPTVTSSGSKRDENALRSNDPTIAYFVDDNDINNAPCMLNLPISVLPEWKSPRVNMEIEGIARYWSRNKCYAQENNGKICGLFHIECHIPLDHKLLGVTS